MGLRVLKTIEETKEFVRAAKAAGKTIGLVPTMGALHEGHLSLMRRAKEQCGVAVASIFVNPAQFGPGEDYDAYPRDFARDCEKLEGAGVDAVFHPSPEEMYPEGYCTYVEVDGPLVQKLCGARRPGHFRGVATVVVKLIHIMEADAVFFGQKDAQQAVVVRRFARDLNLNTRIEMAPIERAASGLALSSRNRYLSAAEKRAALVLFTALKDARDAYQSGEKSARRLRALAVKRIESEPLASIDYAEIYSFPELSAIETIDREAIIALAVRFGKTRLIDNAILGG